MANRIVDTMRWWGLNGVSALLLMRALSSVVRRSDSDKYRREPARKPLPVVASKEQYFEEFLFYAQRASWLDDIQPPIGESSPREAAVVFETFLPALALPFNDAIIGGLAANMRAKTRQEIIGLLRGILTHAAHPENRALVWMPDEDWKQLALITRD